MQPDPVPIDVTPTNGAPTPATHGPSSRVRWAIVGFVALLAVLGGATVLLQLRRPGPASAEKLAELLVDPGGRTTTVSTSLDPITGEQVVSYSANGPGERWTVTRSWNRPGTNQNFGWLNLTQYETEDQARTGFTRAAEELQLGSLTLQIVPGHPDASFRVGQLDLVGSAVQPVAGAGVKGTIVVWGLTTSDTLDWLQQIIVEQLGRLP